MAVLVLRRFLSFQLCSSFPFHPQLCTLLPFPCTTHSGPCTLSMFSSLFPDLFNIRSLQSHMHVQRGMDVSRKEGSRKRKGRLARERQGKREWKEIERERREERENGKDHQSSKHGHSFCLVQI